MKILHVVGARPNFMKACPIVLALDSRMGVEQRLVHTGQHYDINMSDVFFDELGLPQPDFNLNVGSGTHTYQTATVMLQLEHVLNKYKTDLVLVYGDVNSTLAASLVSKKMQIPVGHIEAGLRSFDMSMPEEVNRLLTDHISEILFTHSENANMNLIAEGINENRINFAGNLMIDTLKRLLPRVEDRWADIKTDFGRKPFALVTLHRAETVDDPVRLNKLLDAFAEISRQVDVLFPVHPRTREVMTKFGIKVESENLRILDPLGYVDFLTLQSRATMVITDSGGVQEESTYLEIPCLTVREKTERPVTVDTGTNTLVGYDIQLLLEEVAEILAGNYKSGSIPPRWDGNSAERVVCKIC